jgi:hypothetical protein
LRAADLIVGRTAQNLIEPKSGSELASTNATS